MRNRKKYPLKTKAWCLKHTVYGRSSDPDLHSRLGTSGRSIDERYAVNHDDLSRPISSRPQPSVSRLSRPSASSMEIDLPINEENDDRQQSSRETVEGKTSNTPEKSLANTNETASVGD